MDILVPSTFLVAENNAMNIDMCLKACMLSFLLTMSLGVEWLGHTCEVP